MPDEDAAAGPAMLPAHVEVLAGTACRLGESPVWDAARSRLIWTDIEGRALHMLSWPDRRLTRLGMRARVGSLGLTQSGRLVLGCEDGVFLFDEATGETTALAMIEADDSRTRLNDGKVGPDGAFWIGSMDQRPQREPIGALYRVTADGRVERKIEGLKVSNGLAWSPDGRTMFHSDSRAQWIDAWDFDPATGAISGRRRIATPSEEQGRPDGGACDADGFYWSAGVSGAWLNRWSRDGELTARIVLPLPSPTMPCFGGPDLATLFVTSLSESPAAAEVAGAGSLMMLAAPVRGAQVHRFDDV
jgi:sugar lactone lactonase YvrE